MNKYPSDDEARVHLRRMRTALSAHIPDTAKFVAEVILVSTTLVVASNLIGSSGLGAIGRLLPFTVFLKIVGFALPSERNSPKLPVLFGLGTAIIITGITALATIQATDAAMLQLNSSRLQTVLLDREKLAVQTQANQDRGAALKCFTSAGPLAKDKAECDLLAAFFEAHGIATDLDGDG